TDITNMYVRVAIDGGMLTLMLFLTLLKRSFAGVGRALRAQRHASLPQQHCIWALGASLFAHVVTFLAVWYWDQNIVNWYLLLAMIAIVSGPAYGVRKQTQELSVEIEIKAAAKPEQARLSLSSSLP